MGLKSKLVSHTSIKYPKGDVFQILKFPYHFADITPTRVQSVHLLAGQWGTVGSVVFWNFTMCGEKKTAKGVVEDIDEKKKSVTYKLVEGDLMELYNTCRICIDVQTNREDYLITWSLEYEKKSSAVPELQAFIDFLVDCTNDIERSCQLLPN